jgi:hypothetical protein
MTMDANEFERRLVALARREGLTFSTLVSLPPADRDVLVATIVRAFDATAVYRERDVNDILRNWLAGEAAMLETDHVHVRRWLVDTGVLTRTSDCAEYRLAPPSGAIAAIVDDPAIAALDPAGIVHTTREAMAAERARRKAEWLAREGSASSAASGGPGTATRG